MLHLCCASAKRQLGENFHQHNKYKTEVFVSLTDLCQTKETRWKTMKTAGSQSSVTNLGVTLDFIDSQGFITKEFYCISECKISNYAFFPSCLDHCDS